jgi:hypothetical protein
MAIVNKVDLKLKVSLDNVIKYQILTYCFFEDITISNSDLAFLTVLAKNPKMEIAGFCILLTELNIFKSPQSARNALSKAEKKNLVTKNGNNRKTIVLSKKLNAQKEGVVLLDYKILGK